MVMVYWAVKLLYDTEHAPFWGHSQLEKVHIFFPLLTRSRLHRLQMLNVVLDNNNLSL